MKSRYPVVCSPNHLAHSPEQQSRPQSRSLRELGFGTWDGDRLHQVISNLAGNAIGYATARTPVVVKGHVDGGEVVAEVSNQGDPISPDVLPVIFEPFKRGRQEAKSSANHLGLGLYIANQIVLAHGGTLAARSSHGTTTFTMRLPRVASAGSAERRSQDREDGGSVVSKSQSPARAK